jgi:polyisoprenoid-binding protein YceI
VTGGRCVPALLTALSFAVRLYAQETAFEFDPSQTQVTFSLGSMLHTVHGTFQLRRGNVLFDPVSGKASGELVVDATSGSCGNHSRDERMHKSILESDKFPDIIFRPDHVEGKIPAGGSAALRVHGLFFIHGAVHEITIPVQVGTESERISATLRFSIPYVKWGMKNPSTFLLRVSDQAQIEIRAVGRQTAVARESIP